MKKEKSLSIKNTLKTRAQTNHSILMVGSATKTEDKAKELYITKRKLLKVFPIMYDSILNNQTSTVGTCLIVC